MKGLERSAAARGLLSSGSTLKGITDYSQGQASQEYGNAYQRYQTNRANQLNPLTGILGMGQTATNNTSTAAGQTGQGLAQSYGNEGQARASGYVGMGNALTNALGQGASMYAQMPYLNAQTGYYNAMAQRAGSGMPMPGVRE
jgi:hypothetical protein